MKKVNVVCALIVKNNHVLAAQRKGGEFDGLWEFPGGKIENDESPQQALVREIKEEFEVDLIVDDLVCSINYSYPTFHLFMDCYLGRLNGQDIVLNDHHQVQWVDLNEPTESVEWIPADIEVYEKLQTFVISSSYKS